MRDTTPSKEFESKTYQDLLKVEEINREVREEDVCVDEAHWTGNGSYKWDIVWTNVFLLAFLHLGAIYGFYVRLFYGRPCTMIFAKVIGSLSALGVTAGAHRLWSHRTYKASRPLQILLAAMMTLTYQNSIFIWCRDHRLHHKFSETDADPHNAKRGFFFSHMGWLLVRKHPEVLEKGKLLDMSDLKRNKIVMFQHKYYTVLVILWGFAMPTLIPYYFMGEDLVRSFFAITVYRYIISVHLTWSINSLAHLYGPKPYNKNIGPTENPLMIYCGFGEGFHNYHHTFPWDYRASEYGADSRNVTTVVIDFFAWVGWAKELKVVGRRMVDRRAERTGDGSPRVPDTWTWRVMKSEKVEGVRSFLLFSLFMYVL